MQEVARGASCRATSRCAGGTSCPSPARWSSALATLGSQRRASSAPNPHPRPPPRPRPRPPPHPHPHPHPHPYQARFVDTGVLVVTPPGSEVCRTLSLFPALTLTPAPTLTRTRTRTRTRTVVPAPILTPTLSRTLTLALTVTRCPVPCRCASHRWSLAGLTTLFRRHSARPTTMHATR